jgi:hypothetical protein
LARSLALPARFSLAQEKEGCWHVRPLFLPALLAQEKEASFFWGHSLL